MRLESFRCVIYSKLVPANTPIMILQPARFYCVCLLLFTGFFLNAQTRADSIFPVRGFAIAAPPPQLIDSFIIFINNELAPRNINTLMLRVDFGYQYKSHPELVQTNALSGTEIKKIVSACRQHNIRIIPQVNLLGHQSWATRTGKLLEAYPQFDETPHVKMPAEYKWPNEDSLYCKSYCPLHPDVHKVVFAIMDEICEAFESDAFHAGMDEVFYISDDKCPRCSGKDKAVLFAGEVKKIRDHLALNKRELWIWGDRLLDGRATGVGMWEGSYNNTHRAIDMIPNDVVICDWHYERADKTAVYLAMKGFRVITCPWRNPEVTKMQVRDMFAFRKESAAPLNGRFYGMMQTVWSGTGGFMNEFYGKTQPRNPTMNTAANSFRIMIDTMNELIK